SKWQTELNQLKIQNQQLGTRDKQYAEEKEFYTIKAPLTGTVQELKGIQPGSSISANEILGEISPDSGLIAETYVQPKDIGLLKIGTKARFQIDAYNYNEWGMATGKIISISNDIFMQNGAQPFFKVRCLLDKNTLNLKNGYIGKIKKGMTLQARFFVTRRTLFQLLYDKADDWLNPNVIPEAKETKTTSL
ncbi:MAG: HlyD family efflux transporter periplasmic adaptor subunit, partial [Sphingobacteriales bacterium]